MTRKELAIGLLLGVATVTPTYAADVAQPIMVPESRQVENSGWTFAVSPYFWGAGMSGNVGQFNLPAVHLETDFEDILKDLDFAFMATGEARNQRVSIFGDIIYTKLSSGSGTPRGIVAGSVDLTSETFAGLFGLGYSVLQDERGNLDLVAGLRVWHASSEVSFTGGLLDGVSASDSATWVDGMAGIRSKYFVTENFYVSGWGLIGAGQADLDWDVAATIGYQFNDRFSAVAGYRALGVDYNRDGFVFDVVQEGPILGMVMRF
ncbi:hypothetical protein [Phyllobacterium sp. CCNWLW109]|uniref:hypothetical protein n=1 Tax=Phyllobacterium sp. CCNWLW109 TaxID=3127479 RepID=UPI003FCD20BC